MSRIPLTAKSIVFAILGLALVWLPLVDKIARDEAGFVEATSKNLVYDWGRHRAVQPETLSAEDRRAIETRPPVYVLYETSWNTTLVASAGIVALVLLNHFLQRHRQKRRSEAPKA